MRLEPLNAASHGDDLFEIATVPDAADRFRYLSEEPPESRAAFQTWLEKVQASEDPLYFSVIDKASGKAAGRQTFMRIEPAHGRIEIGHIHWGPAIARKPAGTEAHYLFMRHAFEDLGYRRWEWKCNNRNEPSKRAAERFGFKSEGVFRQHMIVKGENPDTAWYSIIDTEWPASRAGGRRGRHLHMFHKFMTSSLCWLAARWRPTHDVDEQKRLLFGFCF